MWHVALGWDFVSDVRLNPSLETHCKEDIEKLCEAEKRQLSPGQESGGAVLLCLRKHYVKKVPPRLFSAARWHSAAQWSSGSTLACSAIGPRIESRCRQKVPLFLQKITAIRSFGHGLHVYYSA